MAKKKHVGFSFRTILLFLTAVLVGYVVYQNWPDILEAINHLQETNVFVLMILIPEQLFMYFACGQIFFSYLKNQRGVKKISDSDKMRISTELNFVNHAVPAGGLGGLAFLTYRLGPFGVSAGQASFLYIFRYAVTTVINYAQALMAIVVLLVFNLIPSEASWIVPLALVMNMGVFCLLGLVVFIASSKKRIDFFAKTTARVTGRCAKIVTFGHKKQLIKYEKIKSYFADIYESVKIAKENKNYLKNPLLCLSHLYL